MKFIKKIESHETGGGCTVEFVTLADGRVLGINDECVVLYESMDDFYECYTSNRQIIDLCKETEK
jgi:hypothetical protein